MDFDLIKLVIVGVGTVVWYLLKQKDDKQQKELEAIQAEMKKAFEDLYTKHNSDVEKLRDLEVKIASDHYKKSELDQRFDRLETNIREGFKSLGDRFDKLSSALLDHISKEDA